MTRAITVGAYGCSLRSAVVVVLVSSHHPYCPKVRNFLWFRGCRLLARCVFVCLTESAYFAIDWASTPMIIVEQSEVRKSQLNHDPNVVVATSSTPLISSEGPPAYTPREGPGTSSSPAPPYYNPLSPPATQKRRPKSVAKRFVKALLLAFGAFVAIASVIRFFVFAMDPSLHDVR